MLNRLLLLAVGALLASHLTNGARAQDYSEAERLLFLNNHLEKLKKPTALRYHYSKKGSLEKPVEDFAVVRLKSVGGAEGKVVKVEFLTGERKLDLPETTGTTGNPILLNFLERDTREMKRLTGGSTNYFRRRIRIAFVEKFDIAPATISYGGKQLAAKTVTITPFAQDELRHKFAKFEHKTYKVTLCDQIPGEVYEMRSLVTDPAKKDEVLMEEVVQFEGVEK